MSRTPGFIIPSSFPDTKSLVEKLQKQSEESGFSELDDDFFHSVTDGELVHYGVKGMKWGVRHDGPSGVSRSTNRSAKKDAKEFARAKQFYGEGAGTRRKLIKATVEGKSKNNPAYKTAFDHHLSNQDTSKHAAKAKSERKRKNVANSTRRGIRGTSHILRGNAQYASAATAIVVGGAMYAHKAGIDKTILKVGKNAYSKAKDPNGHKAARNLLRDMGIG